MLNNKTNTDMKTLPESQIEKIRKEAEFQARMNYDLSWRSAEERFELMIKNTKPEVETELKSFESLAVEAIRKGKTFNGKFYDYGKKGTFIFVGGQKFQIVNKEAFINEIGVKSKMSYSEAYHKHGLDFAEEGNY